MQKSRDARLLWNEEAMDDKEVMISVDDATLVTGPEEIQHHQQ